MKQEEILRVLRAKKEEHDAKRLTSAEHYCNDGSETDHREYFRHRDSALALGWALDRIQEILEQ